ncbi:MULTISPECIES: PIG-L deacetylase family protein [unclassified Streptomyces]|uniref:PIG-L deacetylase family protein n=1 Tax=unclassified Streptomyces TaxID=2593676 RepID=UPI002DD83B0C|nr:MULTISPECIES: PIG-L deacetylase family protein [unclassified Streptomyces]WSA97407.1 PIG-L family deacetylase [Streptomyces sp. NBC_01795]WSB81835.1 PIG-L family deacetylase [Streptomyces sp. NBC_01775]WSS17402.1 PIG-L family deacetylase [Streptomyces sp. NBC_01186]WSS46148.1 PIG-L family deacetylase [Streptomyces sp. NBC_01187]
MPEGWTRALAVVAHPDDLEYGVAAGIAEWTARGKQISYLLATRGEAGIDSMDPAEAARVREDEQRASAAAVGVTDVRFLDHRDGVLQEGPALRSDIASVIRAARPELVITVNHRDTWGGAPGSPWNTPDHRALGRSVLDAVGDAGNRWIFTEQLKKDGVQPWGGVRWVAVAASPAVTHAVEVGEEAARKGLASLLEHHAYITALTDEDPETYARSIVNRALDMYGQSYGGRRAVAFELHPC